MTAYLVRKKALVNSLIECGTDVSEDSLIDYIVNGLGSVFQNFLHNLHFQLDSMTFDKIFGIL